MLSLRAFSRAIPRSTSRIAIFSTRASLRPAFRTPFRSNVISSTRVQPLRAGFSTTCSRFDETGQELGAKLDKEIEIEYGMPHSYSRWRTVLTIMGDRSANNESTTDSDSNVKAFLDQNDFWTLQDTDGEQEVMLTRSFDDEQIVSSTGCTRSMIILIIKDCCVQHRRLQCPWSGGTG